MRGGSSDRVAASTTAGSREDIAALLERHQSARAGSTGQGRSGPENIYRKYFILPRKASYAGSIGPLRERFSSIVSLSTQMAATVSQVPYLLSCSCSCLIFCLLSFLVMIIT